LAARLIPGPAVEEVFITVRTHASSAREWEYGYACVMAEDGEMGLDMDMEWTRHRRYVLRWERRGLGCAERRGGRRLTGKLDINGS
jgi:hypothetical protein